MKHRKAFISLFALLSLLLCACGTAAPVPTAEPTAEPTPTAEPDTGISTVDEFLSAIAPNSVIELEPGEYDLSTASDYGKSSPGAYYTWKDCGEGYELHIADVENLSIIAESPKDTRIISPEPYAKVLSFGGCRNLRLSGFTAGHKDGVGYCTGAVISLSGCENTVIENCSLFGCGTVGISSDYTDGLSVLSCDIYDCSSRGIQAYNSRRILIEDSKIHDCGNETPISAALEFINCEDAAVVNCEVADNDCYNLITSLGSKNVSIMGTKFNDNWADSVFYLSSYSPVILDCSFENTSYRMLYDAFENNVAALDGAGKEIGEKTLWQMEHTAAVFEGFVTEEETEAEQKEVSVSDVDALLAAIAPNTTIYLKAGTYDLSTASGYGSDAGEYYRWLEQYDGPELLISSVDNLRIVGEGRENTVIAVIPRYANVFNLNDCEGFEISGVTLGHTEEPGYCFGGVLNFEHCSKAMIDSCGLYGCGTIGVNAAGCSELSVTGCEIYDCSDFPAYLYACRDVLFENCDIHDCGNDDAIYIEADCSNVLIK